MSQRLFSPSLLWAGICPPAPDSAATQGRLGVQLAYRVKEVTAQVKMLLNLSREDELGIERLDC